MPFALSTAPSDTFYPSTAALQHTKQKVQGWQIFHAYDIWATAHPPTLTQESERRGEGGFEDGLPDHVTRKEAAMSKQQFQETALRVSGVCVGRGIQMLIWCVYFYVNRRILFISAVKYFRP